MQNTHTQNDDEEIFYVHNASKKKKKKKKDRKKEKRNTRGCGGSHTERVISGSEYQSTNLSINQSINPSVDN